MGSLFSSSKGSGEGVESSRGRGRRGNANGNTNRNRKPQPEISSKDKAVLDLKVARDKLKRYQAKLEKENEALTNQAKELLKAKKKDRAVLALKMKKYKQQQIASADKQLLNVLQMVDTIEWETHQKDVFDGLKAGNEVLEKIRQEMSVEDVERLMEETEEASAYVQEINDIISGSLSTEDEEEVLAEYEQLQRLEADELGLKMPTAPTEVPMEVKEAVDATTEKAPDQAKSEKRKEKKKVAEPIPA